MVNPDKKGGDCLPFCCVENDRENHGEMRLHLRLQIILQANFFNESQLLL